MQVKIDSLPAFAGWSQEPARQALHAVRAAFSASLTLPDPVLKLKHVYRIFVSTVAAMKRWSKYPSQKLLFGLLFSREKETSARKGVFFTQYRARLPPLLMGCTSRTSPVNDLQISGKEKPV
jgi:hypothetical protein